MFKSEDGLYQNVQVEDQTAISGKLDDRQLLQQQLDLHLPNVAKTCTQTPRLNEIRYRWHHSNHN